MSYTKESAQTSITGQMLPENRAPLTFTQQAEQLKQQLNITSRIAEENFLHELVNHLPLKAYLQTRDSKVTDIKIIQ